MAKADAPGPLGPDEEEQPFRPDQEPFHGFELQALVDHEAYQAGQVVRITVTVYNGARRFVEHRYPGWERFEVSIRDEQHRSVAETHVDRPGGEGFVDRWLPGQMAIFPVYWSQGEGPLVPEWTDDPPGPRPPPGRYRARISWLGREAGSHTRLPDARTPWFRLV